MLDDIKNASLSVREKIMEKISLKQKLENSSGLLDDAKPESAAEVTKETLAMKENEIKALDQKISLGSEIDTILETQHLEAIADPTKVRLPTLMLTKNLLASELAQIVFILSNLSSSSNSAYTL